VLKSDGVLVISFLLKIMLLQLLLVMVQPPFLHGKERPWKNTGMVQEY
jgi:hypothetical protein